MPEPKTLVEAVDRLADRFRAMPQTRLLGAVPGHPSRAAAALALARRLAAVALAVEGARPRDFPDAGAFAAGDQLAVAGHELAAALTALDALIVPAVYGGVMVTLPVALGAHPAGSAVIADALLGVALAEVAATADLCR
ncbi:hypothetical protein [Kitasatospora sp. NPDC057223]|uniref:hypothetical protein n=1 Tax=Kitasatospora sp. NPDC057223 TaxID=3346055 RepID=UPI00362C2ABA